MNIALIGCGPRGEALAPIVLSLGHAIACCADTQRAVAARVASRLNTRSAASILDAVSDVDAVLFSEPRPADAAPALRALHAHTHVFWNAPLTHDPKTARTLLDAAKSSGVVLAPAYPNRVCPQCAAAAAQSALGSIGKVGFVRVHRHASASESTVHGAALDSLAGDLDFIVSTFGAVGTVYAQVVRKKPVDAALLTLTTRGPIVQCAASTAIDSAGGAIELCGESGMVQFKTHEPILTVATHAENSGDTQVESSPVTPDTNTRRVSHFFTAAKKGRTTAAQFKHEMHVVRIVEAALDSARTGRAVKVKP